MQYLLKSCFRGKEGNKESKTRWNTIIMNLLYLGNTEGEYKDKSEHFKEYITSQITSREG